VPAVTSPAKRVSARVSFLPAPKLVTLAEDEIETHADCRDCYLRTQDINVARVNADEERVEYYTDRLRQHVAVAH
jgi:hypothetical protein